MSLNLVIRVRSFFSLPDGGPKTWMQGRTLPTQTIDIHNYSLLHLVDFIAEHYMWGSKHLFWICIYDGMLSIYYQHICMWFQLNFVCHVAVQISVKYLFIFLLKFC